MFLLGAVKEGYRSVRYYLKYHVYVEGTISCFLQILLVKNYFLLLVCCKLPEGRVSQLLLTAILAVHHATNQK